MLIDCTSLTDRMQEYREVQAVSAKLRQEPVGLKLLFVTPEKVARSDALLRLLAELDGRGRLDRVVIDEVRRGCVCVIIIHTTCDV